MSVSNNTNPNDQKVKGSTPTQILKDLFKHYRTREDKLIQLAYTKGATPSEIARTIGVDPSLISRNYPNKQKGASK